MSDIQVLVGFNLIALAITIVIVFICGYEFDWKEKTIGILIEVIVMGMISAGVYLLTR